MKYALLLQQALTCMTEEIRDIIIIGTGNVAYHLTRAFLRQGLNVVQVAARTEAAANRFAADLRVPVVTSHSGLLADADLYVVAVNDDQIAGAAMAAGLKDQLLVHTSGSVAMDVLSGASSRTGVLYPLQTLTYGRDIELAHVPFFIEAGTPEDETRLVHLAKTLSDAVFYLDSEKRKAVHLAAVFASNFSYHMYTIASGILAMNEIPPDILHPLILETARKSIDSSPGSAQTGPAVRQDLKVIQEHLKQLKDLPLYTEIYKLLTVSIIGHKPDTNNEL